MSDSDTETDETDTDYEREIQVGHRVECYKIGPHKGKRGVVADRLGETVVVDFGSTTLVTDQTYFEAV